MVDLGDNAPVDDDDIKSGANLYNADLRRADLSDATLSEANLSEANLSEANLSGADLYNADLYNADLPRVDLSGATLSKANLSKINLSDSSLSSANFSNADLSDANLSEANLSDAYISDTDLSDANLSEANLSDAYVSDADLSGTNLSHRLRIFWRVTDLTDRGRALSVGGFLSELTDRGRALSVGGFLSGLNNQPEASQPQTTTDEQSGTVPSWVWPTIIALATLGWVAVSGMVGGPGEAQTWSLYVFLAVWLVLPIALFMDARALRKTGEWPRYWWGYVLTSMIWFVAVIPAIAYLGMRLSHRSQNFSQAGPPEK